MTSEVFDTLWMQKSKRADTLAEELRGTCQGIMDVVGKDEHNDLELMRMLDDRVFECSECGWWEEVSCQTDDGRCTDCNSDDKDDE